MNFYTLMGENGAHITHLFDASTSDMSKAAWDAISEGKICTEAQSIADVKAELEKLCSEAPCNKQALAVLRQAFDRIQNAKAKNAR
jgi:hypothetical protein